MLMSAWRSLNGDGRQQRGGKTPGVALELGALARRVAVAEDQQIQLPGRIAALMDLDQRSGIGAGSANDELVRRIDFRAPDIAKRVPGIALPDDDADGPVWRGESQRLGERAVGVLRLCSCLPLAVDRAEAARVQHGATDRIGDLEEVLAPIGLVDRPRRVARPGQRFEDDAIDAEALFLHVAGVVVVQPHRLRSRGPGTGGSLPRKRQRGLKNEEERQRVISHIGSVWLQPDRARRRPSR